MSTVTVPCPRCGEVEEGQLAVEVDHDRGCWDYPEGWAAAAYQKCSLGCFLTRPEQERAEDVAIRQAQEVARGD